MATLEVYKFGGTSLGSAERVRCAARLVRACPSRVIVIVSAMSGITDLLATAAARAELGDVARDVLDTISRRHREAAEGLGLEYADTVAPILEEIERLLAASAASRGLSPRIRDRVLVTGEKLSARLLAGVLSSEEGGGGGGAALHIDADTFLETDDNFGEASPLFDVYTSSVRAALRPVLDSGTTPIVTGYCGRAPCGSTTTLGRGGSDYSATLIAAAKGADRVTIWTDVPGVFSADPAIVPGARVLGQLNYREAGELSLYGARVLHPSTIQPLISVGVPVWIRSSFEPEAGGTRIDGAVTVGSHPVKAVSAATGFELLSVEGFANADRLIGALIGDGIAVPMSTRSITGSPDRIAVPRHRVADAMAMIHAALREDSPHAGGVEVGVETDIALVAAVGLGMNQTEGISSRVIAAVAGAGVHVSATAQEASDLSITFAVHQDDYAGAVRAVHAEFGLHLLTEQP